MSSLNCISPNNLVVLAAIIAILIAKDRTANENNVIGNLIVAVGSLILTIAAQQQSLPSQGNDEK